MRYIIVKIILCLFLLPGLSSCKKDNENIIHGNITELITGNPLENVRIILKANEISSGTISTSFKALAETNTDYKGDYKFEFEAKKAVSYRLILSKVGFLPKTVDINASDYIATYEVNKKLAYSSHLKLNVRNLSPFDNDDNIKVRITGSYDDYCSNCCHSNIREFNGIDVNEIISCPVIGNDSIKIMSIVEKNQNTSVKEFKLFCPPGDTLRYNLDY